jgi:pilus assembly protein CpaF
MVRLRFSRNPADKPVLQNNAPVPAREPERVPAAPASATQILPTHTSSQEDHEFIQAVQSRLISEPDPPRSRLEAEPNYFHNRIAAIVHELIEQSERVVSEREKARLVRLAQADILGLGPLEMFLADDSVSEIMVNGPRQIWIEREGRLSETSVTFQDDEHVQRIITRIIAPLGRRCDETSPMVDARLPDGSRVNAIIPPLCLNGPSLTIRKFSRVPLTMDNLIDRGALTPEVAEFLRACVVSCLNVVVAGGTGSGKTTLLNVLTSFVPEEERIITIENAAELRLQQRHVVTLESRPANLEGRGEISIRDLLVNALRMRPNRIVVGECRSGEALDMLQAMNTGHDGSMTTVHANSPRDAIHRLETMSLMAGIDLPQRAIREQISSAVHLIVHVERFQDGSRRLSRICEVTGMEGDVISMSELFAFKHQGFNEGRIVGSLQPTGVRPRFLERLQEHDITLPPHIFGYGAGKGEQRGGRA